MTGEKPDRPRKPKQPRVEVVGDVDAGTVPDAAVEGLERLLRHVQRPNERALRRYEEMKQLGEQMRRDRAEERRLRQLRLEREEQARAARPRKRVQRPPDQLPIKMVRACERELEKRRKAGKPRKGPLTLSAIARRVELPRPRVRQLERLLEIGWPLSGSHPDFSTDAGFVRLPSVQDAALLLLSR